MSSDVEQGIRADRIAKVEAMRRSGIDPYPARTPQRTEVAAVRAEFGALDPGAESGQAVWIAGRISGRRGHGKAIFLDLTDRSGRLQLHATLDVLGEEGLAAVSDCDLGDVVATNGEVFCSRRGELSLRVREWRPLAKCLRPLPEKHHGLADVEQRHRQRYLDLLVNDDARRVALARTAIVTAMRGVLDGDGFFEVETPVLQPLYGGGAAKPFVTFYNEFERDFYLRIADELYLKRLIVGGLERVYEIGKDFRNESVSFKRNPEFSMLEWYEAYADFEGGMQRTERVVAAAGAAAGAAIDLSPPWPRVPLRQAIHDATGIDPMADRDRDRLVAFMREREVDTAGDATWAQAVDHLLSHFVEPTLERPTFLVDYPVELSPFAKRSPGDPGMVERFEAFCLGMEIANGYSELNDPAEQRARFEEARTAAAAGDEEAHPMDEDFLLALEYGMPPTCGVGIGVDRLTMMLTGVRSIREVILFPTLRERG
ncbi:MAG TPA: lysine--tRNA ligase [Gaiellales bacterium]